jgi:hypothetical protein
MAAASYKTLLLGFTNNYYSCEDSVDQSQQMPHQTGQNYSLFQKIINPELQYNITHHTGGVTCNRGTSVLYMLLMLGTLWLALFLYNFRKTPYLTRSKREWLADYALPASVLIMSFAGAYLFSEIESMGFLTNQIKI